MNDTYQAALTLHALHPDDRAWMLSQLSSSEKNAIGALVIQKASQPVDEAHKFDLAVARETLQLHSVSEIVSKLIALDAIQIAQVLAQEPDMVVAGVLEAYHWPWRIAVLDLLGVERKKNIAALEKIWFRQKLVESLLQNLYAHASLVDAHSFSIKTSELSSPSPMPRSLLSLKRIRRWLP